MTGLKQNENDRLTAQTQPGLVIVSLPHRHPEFVSLMLSLGLEMVTEKKVEKIPTAEGGRQSGIKGD